MSEKSYFVRTCIRNAAGKLMSLHPAAKGFIWPEEIGSVVTCPDWEPMSVCRGGLHGLRPGDYDPRMWAEGPNAVWLVCSYDPKTAVVLEGKIKVPSCVVEYVVNESDGASTLVPLWLRDHGVTEPIYHGVLEDSIRATVGDHGIAITGRDGTAIAGFGGRAIAGHDGKAKAGTWGIATSEVDGESHAGNWGYAISGSRGTSTAGKGSFAITQDGGTAIAGSDGIAYAGRGGRATAGDYGKAIVGDKGYAKAGRDGILQITWYQRINNCDRLRIAIGYVGENGIEPDTFYQIDGQGKFVKVETPNV